MAERISAVQSGDRTALCIFFSGRISNLACAWACGLWQCGLLSFWLLAFSTAISSAIIAHARRLTPPDTRGRRTCIARLFGCPPSQDTLERAELPFHFQRRQGRRHQERQDDKAGFWYIRLSTLLSCYPAACSRTCVHAHLGQQGKRGCCRSSLLEWTAKFVCKSTFCLWRGWQLGGRRSRPTSTSTSTFVH